jgi:Rrf2 family protein
MLSQSVGYAVTALTSIVLASDKSILVRDIARATGLPGAYLSKIIHVLARRGLVTTQRGVGGGVSLARPASEISLFDVAVALDDAALQRSCMLGGVPCGTGRECVSDEFWTATHASIIDFLKRTSLQAVAAFAERQACEHASPCHFVLGRPVAMPGAEGSRSHSCGVEPQTN